MTILGSAKDLGAYLFQSEPDDIKVTFNNDLVEIAHEPSGAAVYYFVDDPVFDEEEESK